MREIFLVTSNPHFPTNTLQLMRGAVAAEELGVAKTYVDRVFDAMWTEKLEMGRPEVAGLALTEAGLPAEHIFELSQTQAVKQRLLDNTQAAFDRGAFGSPSFLVGEELFFGKDRLRDIEEEITRSAAVG